MLEDANTPRIPGFVVGDPLGRGETGVVYAGRDAQGREVALKVLHGALAPKRLERFRREAQATAGLAHPCVARVWGAGETEAGRPYLALERVRGPNLERALADGLPWDATLHALAGVAGALAEAHAQGVVHRDVKPANVLLGAEGPRLVDFGLAALAGAQEITTRGRVVGTPLYLPPEVARGEVLQAGPAGDVYALGVILYRCVWGRHPGPADASFDVFMAWLADPRPQPLPTEPALAELPALVGPCLARDPGQRPSAEQLARALERLRAQLSAEVLARPTGWSGRRVAAAAPPRAAPAVRLDAVLRRLVGAGLELSAVLDLVLEFTLEATGASRGFILVADEGGRLTVERGSGLSSDAVTAELSGTALELVRRTRKPVVSSDAQQDARFALQASVVASGLRALVCLPVLEGEELVGAIYLADPPPAQDPQAWLQTLVELSELAAGPIGRARAYQAERRARRAAQEALATSGSTAAMGAYHFVGTSEALHRVLRLLSRVAGRDLPVLIEGESGTGKELAARYLHDACVDRGGPFVAENCGSFAEGVLESELFGVRKGAFTGATEDRLGLIERADGGTLFLDEIGELGESAQAKLLRVLQEREVRPLGAQQAVGVDLRVVAATHRDLGAMVREGRFRADLYYRLSGLKVQLPPLRERREDIPHLVRHFLDELRVEGLQPPEPTPEELARLVAQDWPGNVRELRNALFRLATAGELELGPATEPIAVELGGWEALPDLKAAREAFDRVFLTRVMERAEGNVAEAARLLGMQRPNLSRLLKRLGLR